MRSPRERVLDMLEAINRIEKYADRGREAFETDELIQTYLLHYLQVLGEAAFKLPPDFQESTRRSPGHGCAACAISWCTPIFALIPTWSGR